MTPLAANLPLPTYAPTPPTDDAAGVLDWVRTAFAGRRVVASTGFGMEGCVLLDLMDRAGLHVPVVWIDTGFLFDETHALRRRLGARYPRLTFERHAIDLDPAEQEVALGPNLWQRDSGQCCGLRKVVPMRRALANADVWLAALTRDQGTTRRDTPVAAHDAAHDVLKVCPLATWNRPRVWRYVQDHAVPFNPLHERQYPTIGCTHCTLPVPGSRPDVYSRAGRWSGTTKTECGLHGGAGI